MNVTVDQLFQELGKLHIENFYLNKMIAEKIDELSVLRKKMEPQVDEDKDDR